MRLQKYIEIAYIAGAVLLVVIGLSIYKSFQSLSEKSAWVTHSHQVMYASEKLISALKDAETGQRGYFITGDNSYLQPYFSGLDSTKVYFSRLRQLTLDNPSQQTRLDSLQTKIDTKVAALKYVVNLKERNTAQQDELIFPVTGKIIMDDIRKIIDDLNQEEQILMAARTADLDQTQEITKYIIYLIIITAVLTTIFSYIYIRKQIQNSQKYEKELQLLNQEIHLANEELTTYNEELTAVNEELHANNEELTITSDQLNTKNEQLRLYADEIEDLYNNAPCGYHTTNEDGIILNINDTELKWLGYTREEVIGKMKLNDIISSNGMKNTPLPQKDYIENGYFNNMESEMIRKDGKAFPILANIIYEKDANNRFLKARATVFDITEQKKIQQKLIQSEQNYRLMADNISDMITRHNLDGTYFYVSPSSKRLLGYNPEEMTGKSAKDFYHPADLETLNMYYLNLLELPDVSTIEHRVRKKNGQYVWFETVSRAFKDDVTGKISEVLSVSRDISLRKEYEDKLKIAYNELEQIKNDLEIRVRERTEKLDQTLKELQTRNHELDNYVYKVSHDLRAPLASILGLVNLTKLDNDISAIKHYLSLIENRVNKSDEFIKSVLNHSRILNSEIKATEIEFSKIIDNCIEDLKYLPNLERMDFITQINKKSEFLNDELRISIVFKNLISNAIKYRNPRVDKSYMKFDINITEESAFIRIEDNGHGIEELYLNKIFDMFFRGTQQSDGNGLGLYIVKQTLEKIGGNIQVESKVNKGTTFEITIANYKLNPIAVNSQAISLN